MLESRVGRASPLEDLSLHVTNWLPFESAQMITTRLVPKYHPNLTSLTVNYPGYREICELSNLRHLRILFNSGGAPFLNNTRSSGPTIGFVPKSFRWEYPNSCSLETLYISGEGADDDRNFLVYLDTRLANLVTLRLHVLPDLVCLSNNPLALKFNEICPKLEELEIESWKEPPSSALPARIMTLPASLIKFKMFVRQTLFLPEFANLPQLTEVSLLHEQIPAMWAFGHSRLEGFSLDPLLSLTALTKLNIRSVKVKTSAYNSFLDKLTRSAGQLLPFLSELDISCPFINSGVLDLFHSKYPSTKVTLPPEPMGNIILAQLASEESFQDTLPASTTSNTFATADSALPTLFTDCTFCGISVSGLDMDDHESICRQKPRRCTLVSYGCYFMGTTAEVATHLKSCTYFDVKCLDCAKTCTRAHYTEHSKEHEKVLGKVLPCLLTYPAFQTPFFTETYCQVCHETLPTLDALNIHLVTHKSARIHALGLDCPDDRARDWQARLPGIINENHDFWSKIK